MERRKILSELREFEKIIGDCRGGQRIYSTKFIFSYFKKNFLKFVTLLYYATNPGIIRNSINEITSFK